jgi:hypothetical protein
MTNGRAQNPRQKAAEPKKNGAPDRIAVRRPLVGSNDPGRYLSHLSSQAMTLSCQRMELAGLRTQWFSSGK